MKQSALRFLFAAVFVVASIAAHGQKLCFPPHEGLPHHGSVPPTVDGYIERSAGFNQPVLETGWVRSSLVTYGAGASVAVAELRGLKHNTKPYIYLGFTAQFDPSFDAEDVIVIVLRPDFPLPTATHVTTERRIHIYPICQGIGAREKTGVTCAADADDDVTGNLRTNRGAVGIDYFAWNGTAWASITSSLPTNVEVKVQSWSTGTTDKNWSVEVKLPTAILGPDGGGPNWIDLNPNFGIYTNIVRACTTLDCTTIVAEGYTVQFPWPHPTDFLEDDVNNPGLLEAPLPVSFLGEGVLGGTGAVCGGVHFNTLGLPIGVRTSPLITNPLTTWIDGQNLNTFAARVVNDDSAASAPIAAEFRIANWGIAWNAPGTWDKIPVTGATSPLDKNPTDAISIPPGATPTELLMEWKLNSTERGLYNNTTYSDHQCIWVLLSSAGSANITESSVRQNMNFQNLSAARYWAEISGKSPGPRPQSGFHDFILTVNQRFLTLPRQQAQVTAYRKERVSRDDEIHYPKGFTHEVVSAPQDERDAVLLTPQARRLLGLTPRDCGPMTDWLWIVNGYRTTGGKLTIKEKTFGIVEHAGAFGYDALHCGGAEAFRWKLSDGGLRALSDSAFQLSVPHGGAVRINTEIEAVDSASDTGSSRHRFFFDIGPNSPDSGFASFIDGRWSANVGIEKILQPNWSIEAIAGHHSFEGEAEDRFHFCLNIEQFAVNVKRYFGPGPLHWFVNGGGGAYYVDPPEDWNWGVNAGAGVLYDINSRWGIEGAYNYHRVNFSPDDLGWSTLQAGLRISF